VTDLPTHTRFRLKHSHVTWHGEDFGFVLYDRQADAVYEGNHVGRMILELLDNGASVDTICHRVHGCYAISRDVVRHDIEQFRQFLYEEHLLVMT
jgi:hypothetical protein